MRYMTLLILMTTCLLGACKNANFCPGSTNDDCRLTQDASGPKTCTGDIDCTDPSASVCDVTGTKACVQCTTTEATACTSTTPVCGDDHACRACTAHSDCTASLACLPDGSCGTADNVAYVDPAGTDNATCAKDTPCIKLSAAIATNKPYVKLHGSTDDAVSVDSHNVTLLADPGAQLTSTKNGLLLEVKGSSQVAIYDLEITGASGASGFGISLPPGNTASLELHRAKVTSNVAGGISASGGSLTVVQSTIGGNQGGGISVTNSTFTIVANFFFNNGSNTSLVGGVAAGISASTTSRLDFNTFSLNTTIDGVGPAIDCRGNFTASNNVMSNNRSATQVAQTGGTCAHTYSMFSPDPKNPTQPPPGTGNLVGDPLFVDPNKGDLHIQSTSKARHAADPAADLTGIASHDIDGDLRVAPADIGADQVK